MQVIEYARYHVEAGPKDGDDKLAKSEEEVKTWDNEFVKVDQGTLFELILVRTISGLLGVHWDHVQGVQAGKSIAFFTLAGALHCSPRAQWLPDRLLAHFVTAILQNSSPFIASACSATLQAVSPGRCAADVPSDLATTGSQLPEHQDATGPDLPHSRQHDQG